ncbi:probable calcium-binding protein CML22 [Macadamia integrifolia]|uniref:probable calcium-binding protein CML22 n=1 Tax=Macadamia integrifolia TaxID=60698 RepID=UPI001C50229E|nr:probable calcium-binding protein CML22 [Macadamia integrifolia]
MKESPGTLHICPSLKSFFSNKVGSMLCHCNSSNKNKRLDSKLEKKMMEAIKHRGASGKNTFRSMDSIILRFPQFKEELRNIKCVFVQYDEDSNGFIDREELKKCLSKLQLQLTEKEMEELFHSCDFDDSEGIQFNEFIVLLCLIYLLMEPLKSSHTTSKMGSPQLDETFDTIVQAFLFLDKNGDGQLNHNDMVRALNEGSPWEKSPGRITKTRFKEMDWNKSGKVSFKEFLFALTNWVGIDTDDEKEISIT